MDIQSSFMVDEQWYTMGYRLLCSVERAVGPDWTNAKIVDWCRAHGYRFTTRGNFILIEPPPPEYTEPAKYGL